MLKNYIKENKEEKAGDIIAKVNFCKAYINQTETLMESKVIVTTHSRLAFFLRKCSVITA